MPITQPKKNKHSGQMYFSLIERDAIVFYISIIISVSITDLL
jgi:hypothetical protein